MRGIRNPIKWIYKCGVFLAIVLCTSACAKEQNVSDMDNKQNSNHTYIDLGEKTLEETINCKETSEENIEEKEYEEIVMPFLVEEKVYIVEDTGVYIEIFYPALHGFGDAEQEKQINLLIESECKRIIPNEIEEEPWENRIVCAFLDYEIKFMNNNMVSILYEGMNGCMLPGSGLDAVAMATTINFETMEEVTLSDFIADLQELNVLLLSDHFKNISLWEGTPGIDKISKEYSGELEERLLESLKSNCGEYRYIEWYVDGANLVIVSTLGGLNDYNEYSASIESIRYLLSEEFYLKLVE